jgi:hypothetical protein
VPPCIYAICDEVCAHPQTAAGWRGGGLTQTPATCNVVPIVACLPRRHDQDPICITLREMNTPSSHTLPEFSISSSVSLLVFSYSFLIILISALVLLLFLNVVFFFGFVVIITVVIIMLLAPCISYILVIVIGLHLITTSHVKPSNSLA